MVHGIGSNLEQKDTKLSNMELISVLMATDRISNYLNDSIKSILNQTYVNIEIIFVCNGINNDDVYNYLIRNFPDKRLKIYKTPIRQLAFSLNYALSIANGEIIARMDSDDISVLNRFELQYKFLKSNNLDFVGSFLELIDINGKKIGLRDYPINKKINTKIFATNPFAHNTIMCYKNILINNRGYLGGFNTEDYDMWLRLRNTNVKWANMNLYLVKYRLHNMSSQKSVLSYAEASSHLCREFLINPRIITFYYFILSFFKPFILGKKTK